jgi:hypothetical protein
VYAISFLQVVRLGLHLCSLFLCYKGGKSYWLFSLSDVHGGMVK